MGKIIGFLCVSLSMMALCEATTLTVDLNGGADYTDIQSAIDAASDGDTVLVRPGEYVITESINFNRLHDPNNPATPPVKNIIVKSEGGPEVTTIRMSEAPAASFWVIVRFFSRETDRSVLEGFTITGCKCWEGGGIECQYSSPTITSCRITGNLARFGGGVSCLWDSRPTLTRCTISGNSSGIFCVNSSPSLTDCTISDNRFWGLHCEDSASPMLNHCTISGTAADHGISSFSSSVTLSNCIVWGNRGGTITKDDTSSVVARFSCLETNEVWPGDGNLNADPGFCGWPDPQDVYVDSSRPGPGSGSQTDPFPNLSAAVSGFRLSLREDSPCRRSAEDGTDMGREEGPCDRLGLDGRVVHLAPGSYASASMAHKVSIRGAGPGSTVIEGTIRGLQTGTVLERVTIIGGDSSGIELGEGDAPEIRNCIVTGSRGLGGIVCMNASPIVMNCVIAGNATSACGRKVCPTTTAGIYCAGSSPIFVNCTIAEEAPPEVGSFLIHLVSSSIVLENCVVWRNGGELISKDDSSSLSIIHSCIAGATTWPGDGNIDQDPRLVRPGQWLPCSGEGDCLDFSDGFSPGPFVRWMPGDFHLQPGSPCIDNGTCEGAPAFDIDGNPRPAGGGCDIGAYEFVPPRRR